MLPTGRPCSCATNVHRVSEFTYRTKTDKIVHIVHISTPTPGCNSILLHSGLNPAWNFWLSTRFSCCLKMKSVENILGYIWEQFYRFLRGCKPREYLWNCSIKYPQIFKTYFIFRQQKIELNQCQAWSCYYATGCFVAVWGDFFEPKNTTSPKKYQILKLSKY